MFRRMRCKSTMILPTDWFSVMVDRTRPGVSNFFWRPKFQHQNLTRPKQKQMVIVWGYFGHSTPQVRTFMAFLFLKFQFHVKIRQCVFMNFEEGFNKLLNYTTFWLDFDWIMVSLWFVYTNIFRVTKRPATQT